LDPRKRFQEGRPSREESRTGEKLVDEPAALEARTVPSRRRAALAGGIGSP
jgi:hypothetical protein